MINNSTDKSELNLLEEWPVKELLFVPSFMVATADDRVLMGDRDHNGCLLLDLNNHSCSKEKWHQPERIALQEKTGFLFTEKGITDISASSTPEKTIAAVAAKGQYASCWQVGSNDGYVLEAQAFAVAVAPNAASVAVGLGRWVLDSVSSAQAEVVIWDIPENEILVRRKLPGSCVVQLLWIQNEAEAFYNYTDGRGLDELIIVTTVTRNQSEGFGAILDPLDLRIIEIADIPTADLLRPIAAWPQEGRIWAGGFRYLDKSFHEPELWLKPSPEWAPCITNSRSVWLSENRLFRIERNSDDQFIAQILGSLSPKAEETAEEISR